MLGKMASALFAAMTISSSLYAAESQVIANVAGHKAPFKIAFSNGYNDDGWRAQYVADIQRVADELKTSGDIGDFRIVVSTAGTSGQIAQINSLINSGLDALVINPQSNEALNPVITRALAAGILVVTTDNPLAHSGVLSVTSNHTQFEDVMTRWLVGQLKGRGDIVAVDGTAGVAANELRVQARSKVLAENPDVKLVAVGQGGWDEAKARDVMSSLITAHDKIDGVVVQDVMAEGVVRAYEASGKPIPPMSGDYVHSFLKLWKSKPDITTMAIVNPPGIGATTLRIAVALLRGGKLKPGVLTPSPVNADIVNTILAPDPIVVTRQAETGHPWCTEVTKCIGLDEALASLDGKPDSAVLDQVMTQQQVLSAFFQNGGGD